VVRPKNFERTCDDDSVGKKFDGVYEEQLSQLIATLKRILDFELNEAEEWEVKASEDLRKDLLKPMIVLLTMQGLSYAGRVRTH
jgi:hypothetical protein